MQLVKALADNCKWEHKNRKHQDLDATGRVQRTQRQNENTKTGNGLGGKKTIHLMKPSQCLELALEASTPGYQRMMQLFQASAGKNQNILLLDGALAEGNWEVVRCSSKHFRTDNRKSSLLTRAFAGGHQRIVLLDGELAGRNWGIVPLSWKRFSSRSSKIEYRTLSLSVSS
jgi:hypothetical protein